MTVSIIVQLWLTERLTTYVPFLLLLYSIDPKAVILYYFLHYAYSSTLLS